MVPLDEHALLLFWAQLLALLATARTLGGLMHRLGQPSVVGELAAGLLLGPSVFGTLWPGGFEWLFPTDDAVQSAALLAVSWLGVALLLVVTGFETDLKLVTSLGRTSLLVSTGSLVAPLLLGFALGLVLPDTLLGAEDLRVPFALFMAVALSISALPVVAKILMDMDLMRRNLGQVTVAAGMANDLVGWVLLGTVAGIASQGGFQAGTLARTIAFMALFLGLMLTVGQRLIDAALRRVRPSGVAGTFGVVIVAALGAGVLTQLIGVEAVLGAFVAGVVLGRSRYQQGEVRAALETVVHGALAPVFFATAGLSVDLATLADPATAMAALAVLAVAALAKLGGSLAGARLGGMSGREGLAVGVGLNARGAMEIVVATVGLGLGVLNAASYTIVVVLAMSTSLMAPPLLRRILRGLEAGPEEAERLQREATLDASVIAGTSVALLPSRGGANSLLAARLIDLALQPETKVAVCTVRPDDEPPSRADSKRVAERVGALLPGHRVEHIERVEADPAAAILAESRLGYELVAMGVNEGLVEQGRLSAVLQRVLAECEVPVLIVRRGRNVAPGESPAIGRLVAPATGTRESQAAQEVAYTLANRLDAQVDVVHVDTRPAEDQVAHDLGSPRRLGTMGLPGQSQLTLQPVSAVMLDKARSLARRFGRDVDIIARSGVQAGPELLAVAQERGADAIVVGAQVRRHEGELFLGHGVEHLLARAPQTLVAVVFPEDR